MHATIDLAGHFAHPPGVKTLMLAASMMFVSPAAVLPAAFLVAGVARAGRASGLPGWFRAFSAVAAVAAFVGVVGFASYVSGAVALALLPVWMLLASAVLLDRAWRRASAPA